MPTIDTDQLIQSSFNSSEQPATLEETPPVESTFSETMGASFDQINTISNVVDIFKDSGVSTRFDENFNPFDPENIAGYEDRAEFFIGVGNIEEHELRKTQLDREDKNARVLASAPTYAAVGSTLAAAIVDPLILLPFVKVIQTATKSKRVISGLTSGAAFGAAAGIAREGVLQTAQLTRTMEESTYNILAETVIGSLLGGGFALLSNPAKAASKEIFKKAMRGEDYAIKLDPETGAMQVDRSAGAAQVRSPLEEEGLAYINNNLVKAVSGLGIAGLQSPTVRGLTSKFGIVREFTNKLFNHNFVIGKETKGITKGRVAEEQIRRSEAELIQINKKVNELYLAHTEKGVLSSALITPKGKLSFKEFNTRVSRILNDESIVDDIAQVNSSAKLYRSAMDDMASRLQAAKLLPDDLDPSIMRNYLSRVYDTKKLVQLETRNLFLDRVGSYLAKHTQSGDVRKVALEPEIAEVEALKVYDNIMKEGDRSMSFNQVPEEVMSKGSFTKERKLLMPNADLEPFLITDAQSVVSNYLGRANSLLHTQNAIKDMGFENLADLKQSMKSEKDAALEGVQNTAQREKIQKSFNKDINLVDDMYRLMTGTLRKPGGADRHIQTLLNFQFVRLLGGVTISSIPELGMAPLRLGLLNTLRDGYLPLIRSLKTAKLARDQFKDLNVGLEIEQNNVLRALSGTEVELGRNQTEWDRTMSTIVDVFGKATGLSYYTAFGRRLAAHTASADIIRTMKKVSKGDKLPPKEIQRLATLGVGKEVFDDLIEQVGKHSQSLKGSWISNHHLWAGSEGAERASEAFKTAVQRQVEQIIIRPSKGDIPLFAQRTALGKVIFQFKSFSSAATGRITLSGLQQRDAKTLMGLLYLTALGTTTGIIKDRLNDVDSPDDPAELMADGFARSGVGGLIATTMLDTVLTLSNEKTRRFGGKFLSGQVLGPSVGLLQDMGDITARLSDGALSAGDKKAIARMFPFYNTFYIKYLVDNGLLNQP